MMVKSLQAIFLLSLFSFGVHSSYSLPLSTNGSTIVDLASGQRVKLACAAWVSHLKPMIPEGLDKLPLVAIVARVVQQKFNCIRLTYATYMFTRFYASTVTQTLDSLNLTHAKEGIQRNNPGILEMTHISVFEAAVDELGKQGIMVILDNHVSNPKWCCADNDGNGFFGDADFDPYEWQQGLSHVADLSSSKTQVVAMALRNEPRGPRVNAPDWYKYITQGAKLVHKLNPNVLVFVSAVTYATDLRFLKNQPLGFNLDNKLVFETHWYSWTINPHSWIRQPLNNACSDTIRIVFNQTGFVTSGDSPVPLFLGEFGIDQRGSNVADNNYINCLLAYAARLDLSWCLWGLQGSYYRRFGQLESDEVYAVLDFNWTSVRNPDFIRKLESLQGFGQGPTSDLSTFPVMYHPDSGSCVQFLNQELHTDNSCLNATRWIHQQDGSPLRLMRTYLCLKVAGDGLPPQASLDCDNQQSQWYSVSSSKLQLAAKDQQGQYLCLDKPFSNSTQILTNKCICINDDPHCMTNPQSQWFTLAPQSIA